MGLPSGLLWADRNLGATTREGAGLYVSWGNIFGSRAGSGYDFSQEVYTETPAALINTNLTDEQDIVREQLGEPYRMPTQVDFQELVDNCTSIWATQNGVPGRLFTSNINGQSIFLPAAGIYSGSILSDLGTYGYYWSRNYKSAGDAYDLRFLTGSVGVNSFNARHLGATIRPVQNGTPNRSFVPLTPEEPKEEETPTTEEPKDDNQR